ncbi:MAG: hypothetical protein V1837_07045 [Candidatus Woesearchaeota archaeon]
MKQATWAALLIGLLLACGAVYALPTVDYVKINGDVFESGDQLVVERGDILDIRVKLLASQNEENVEVAADILGYEYNDVEKISESTEPFDMDANDTVYKTLQVQIPENAEKDRYDLRVRVGSRRGASFEGRYALNLQGARHQLTIRDIVLSPENNVQAGRALLTTVRIKNYGEKDEEGIKIQVSIPALGISASDYIDTLEADESTSSEELYLRIPNCATPGIYKIEVVVEYDDGHKQDTAETSILLTDGDLCKPATPITPGGQTQPSTPQTIISVGATTQDVTAGAGGVIYPLTLTNNGQSSKTYMLSIDGTTGWADARVSPSNTLIIGPGETKAAFIYVAANSNTPAGQRMFSVTVSSGADTLKQIPMTANVVGATQASSTMDWNKVKQVLEIGLVVLIVILVILGLIIGFNKLRGSGEGSTEEKEKSYY